MRAISARPAVMIVDDDHQVRKLLETILGSSGLRVISVADGHAAAEQLRTDPGISLVLLDVQMPELDGPGTLDLLLKVKPKLHCCFVTGDPNPWGIAGLLAMGARAVFEKPILMSALVQAVSGLLESDEKPRTNDEVKAA
jgi:DNA-binding NtrC family response regulator